MNGTTLVLPRKTRKRQCQTFATDAATELGEQEVGPGPSPRSEDLDERVPRLAQLSLRPSEHPEVPWEKLIWCSLMEARNHLVHFPDFDATDDDLGYPEDATTSAAPWWQQPERSRDRPRGVVVLTYPREVIFTEQVELEIQKLPRWRPRIISTGRHLENNDG